MLREQFPRCQTFAQICEQSWANCGLLAAWRKVGVAGGRFDPGQIDRSHFIDRVELGSPSRPVTRTLNATVDQVVKTPDGMRGGSLEGMKAKLAAVTAHARMLEAAVAEANESPFDPQSVPFLMKPRDMGGKKKRDRSQVDMSLYEGGSASLRNINAAFKAKRAAEEAARAAVDARKEARTEAKSAAEAAAERLVEAFELCVNGCVCGATPCPVAGMKACDTCRAAGRPYIKARQCIVRECVAARKGPEMLLLTRMKCLHLCHWDSWWRVSHLQSSKRPLRTRNVSARAIAHAS
jgi:hypothetical protein